MILVHPARGQPTVLALGVEFVASRVEVAKLATLKNLKQGHKLRVKIIGPDTKSQTFSLRTLEPLEAGIYEDVTLEVIYD